MDKAKSKCCNAEIDLTGGGYDGYDICPIQEICKDCEQILTINGLEQEIIIIKKQIKKDEK